MESTCTFKTPLAFKGDEEGTGSYRFSETDGCVRIVGYDGNEKNIVIPDTIGGRPVTEIGADAFYVTEEGSMDHLTADSVIIPDSVRVIEKGAFSHVGARNIRLPAGLVSAEAGAFGSGCLEENLHIPDGVLDAKPIVLNECCVKSIIVSSENERYTACDGMLFSKDGRMLIRCPSCYECKKPNLPEGTEAISEYAFYNCRNIEEITLPGSVRTIGKHAFTGCRNLRKVTAGGKESEIGEGAFSSCPHIFGIDNMSTVSVFSRDYLDEQVLERLLKKGDVPIETVEGGKWKHFAAVSFARKAEKQGDVPDGIRKGYIRYFRENADDFIDEMESDQKLAAFVLRNVKFDIMQRQRLLETAERKSLMWLKVMTLENTEMNQEG